LDFVDSADLTEEPTAVARDMRSRLRLESSWANTERTWTDALVQLRAHVEAAGVLVVLNGVVGNNTHRKLDPEEFRGFALVDEYAPLIVVNNADYKAAQMFTLVHELAHVWTGTEGVSNFADPLIPLPNNVERFCNRAAAEFLVPENELQAVWDVAQRQEDPFDFLAKRFKVSSLVAARCALDSNLIDRDSYFDFYRTFENDTRREQGGSEGGGNFWNNQNFRIGKRFGTAVIQAVKEGRLLYRDAYSLTGLTGETFNELVQRYGENT
jgi:Zn-dependent peptidase ImmA (M78 family)